MNLFGTVLTYTAPSCNYRGESVQNRTIIQKITKGRHQYAIISPEAMRNALRETLRTLGLPCNRKRLLDQEQLAVEYEDFPNEKEYADDFFMGWMIAATREERKKHLEEIKKRGRNPDDFLFKRDSIIRMNFALALEPYRHDSVFSQSPMNIDSPWQNAPESQLLHREVTYTAFQYPFAINLNDCKEKREWTKKLLEAIGQLNNVSGNQARSYFEMAPASILVRLTPLLVCGYDTYGFGIDENGKHVFPEVVEAVLQDDLPCSEFYMAGKIIKDMEADMLSKLKGKGVTVDRSPQHLLEIISERAFPV